MLHPEIHSRLFNELGLGHPKRALPQSYIPRSFVLAAPVILKPPVIMLTYRVITTFLPAKHVSTESLNFFFLSPLYPTPGWEPGTVAVFLQE